MALLVFLLKLFTAITHLVGFVNGWVNTRWTYANKPKFNYFALLVTFPAPFMACTMGPGKDGWSIVRYISCIVGLDLHILSMFALTLPELEYDIVYLGGLVLYEAALVSFYEYELPSYSPVLREMIAIGCTLIGAVVLLIIGYHAHTWSPGRRGIVMTLSTLCAMLSGIDFHLTHFWLEIFRLSGLLIVALFLLRSIYLVVIPNPSRVPRLIDHIGRDRMRDILTLRFLDRLDQV